MSSPVRRRVDALRRAVGCLALAAAALLPLAGCQQPAEESGGSKAAGEAEAARPLAVAESGEGTERTLEEAAMLAWVRETRPDLAHAALADEVLAARAADAGVSLDEDALAAEVDIRLDAWAVGQLGVTGGDTLGTALGEAGAAAVRVRIEWEVRRELLARALLQSAAGMTDERLRDRFEHLYGEGTRTSVGVMRFTASVDSVESDWTTAEHAAELPQIKSALETRMTAWAGEITAGDTTVSTLADEHGEDRSASAGGDLGSAWTGRFGAGFDQAVEETAVGEVTGPLASTGGYHLLEVYGEVPASDVEVSAVRVNFGASDGRPIAARLKQAQGTAASAAAVVEAEGFEAAVQRFSTDPRAAETAGRLGTFPDTQWGAEVAAILRGLEVGEVSEPVQVGREIWVIRLDARTPAPERSAKQVRHVYLSWRYPEARARRLGPKLEEAARERASAARARVVAGESFADVAREASEDANTRELGGEIPRWRAGMLGPAVDSALEGLSVGEVSSPVAVDNGWVLVTKLSEMEVAFDDVRDELARDLAVRPVTRAEVRRYLGRLVEAVALSED